MAEGPARPGSPPSPATRGPCRSAGRAARRLVPRSLRRPYRCGQRQAYIDGRDRVVAAAQAPAVPALDAGRAPTRHQGPGRRSLAVHDPEPFRHHAEDRPDRTDQRHHLGGQDRRHRVRPQADVTRRARPLASASRSTNERRHHAGRRLLVRTGRRSSPRPGRALTFRPSDSRRGRRSGSPMERTRAPRHRQAGVPRRHGSGCNERIGPSTRNSPNSRLAA
jgi:hypothetical protein